MDKPMSEETSILTKKDIQNFVKSGSSSANKPLNLSLEQKFFIEAKRALEGEKATELLENTLETESEFLELLQKKIVEKRESPSYENPISRRVFGSDTFLLYHLIVNKGLDRLYYNFTQRTDHHPKNVEQILALKTEIAWRFVEHQRSIIKEQQSENSPVTIGVEVEYRPPQTTTYNYSNAYMSLLSHGFNMEQETNEKPKYPLNSSKTDRELFRKLLDLAKHHRFQRIPTAAWLFDIEINFIPRESSIRRLSNVTDSSTIDTAEVTGREIITDPSLSPKTQLKDLLIASERGELGNIWNLHVTLGGVELSPEHTEIMDSLLISAAGGFVPQNLLDATIEKQESTPLEETGLEWDILTLEDKYLKRSNVEGYPANYFLFPFHKTRKQTEIEDYPEFDKNKKFVEIRGLLKYNTSEFPQLVRYIEFTYLSGLAIHALQLPKIERTRKDEQMVKAWESLRKSTWKLFIKNHIPVAKNYYDSIPATASKSEEADKSLDYNQMLTEIILQSSYTNPELQKQMRKLVLEFRIKMGQVLSTHT